MAIETLKDIKEIDGFKIIRDKPTDMSWDEFDKIRNEYPINITDKINSISFKIQNGPTKEVGVNGCQVDTLIEAAKLMLEGLNDKFYSTYNTEAIRSLNAALTNLKHRKRDRELRNVEGESKQ